MSQEIMRYATLEDNNYLYVHTVEDHSEDHNTSTEELTRGYVFSYPIMDVNEASQSHCRHKRVDDYISNGGTETETFTTQKAFDTYIEIIKHQHSVNELYIIEGDNIINITVGELAHQVLIKLRASTPHF